MCRGVKVAGVHSVETQDCLLDLRTAPGVTVAVDADPKPSGRQPQRSGSKASGLEMASRREWFFVSLKSR